MFYPLLKPLLFSLDAERAHHLTLDALRGVERAQLSGILFHQLPMLPREVMGLTFPNPVGLAAGLDKNGEYIDALAALGFGFIEIGTVTPRPQPGNPKPRLFRIPEAHAIVNRMGFNNHGVDYLVRNVQAAKYKGILGINIGKNFDTPIERATEDYLFCLRKVYSYANYITVNISSPNTKNLRQLQRTEELTSLLQALKKEQMKLADAHGKYVPLAVKISPDLETVEVAEIARILLEHSIDGVIATNTTITRPNVAGQRNADEQGGLSGAPLQPLSNTVIRMLAATLNGKMPIIGVGGIASGQDAAEKFRAGAVLIQLYSGLIYRGPELVREIGEYFSKDLRAPVPRTPQ